MLQDGSSVAHSSGVSAGAEELQGRGKDSSALIDIKFC